MTEELISIIVPVYNYEPLLRRCADSIIAQTYANLEIILVDDGSTDGSGSICDEYGQKDLRVRVIHKENGGLASARNAGLKIASGGWIGWVDADDYADIEMYETLYRCATDNGADVAVCKYQVVNDNGPMRSKIDPATGHMREYTGVEALKNYFTLGGEISSHLWNKLYRRELYADVVFPEGRKVSSDNAMFCKLLVNAKKVVSMDSQLYYYYQSSESLSRSVYNIRHLDVLATMKEQLEILRDQSPELYEYALVKYYDQLQSHYYQIMKFMPDRKMVIKGLIREYNRNYRKDLSFFRIFNHPSGRGNGKVSFIVFWFSPGLGWFIMNLGAKVNGLLRRKR